MLKSIELLKNNGYKLELQMHATTKLFGRTKTLIGKAKNAEKVPSLEVIEIVLPHCNLVDNRYQEKSEVLHPFTSNKPYAVY